MAKSNKSSVDNYREPVTANDTIEIEGCIYQLEISKEIELQNGDFGEKTSNYLKEGVVIPAYDTIKEDKEIGE